MIREEEVKPTLFIEDMIDYVENPKESTKKLLDPITEFSKVSGYNMSI